MTRVWKTFFFRNHDWHSFRRFGLKEPRLSETKVRKCATSIVERVLRASLSFNTTTRTNDKTKTKTLGTTAVLPAYIYDLPQDIREHDMYVHETVLPIFTIATPYPSPGCTYVT